MAGAIFLRPRDLGQKIQLQRGGIVSGGGKFFRVVAAEAFEFQIADCGVEREAVAVRLRQARVIAHGVVFSQRVVVTLGIEELHRRAACAPPRWAASPLHLTESTPGLLHS